MNWREKWELAAADEKAYFDSQSADKLLRRIENGWFGNYYSLWRSIEHQGTLDQFGWALMDVLRGKASYLNRYHCARALLGMMGEKSLEAVHLSGDIPGREENLDRIEEMLVKRIGKRRD